MKIIIDARFFGIETGIGRYVKEVIEGLERIDSDNQYIIFLCEKNFNLFNPKNPSFIKRKVDIKWYSLREQLELGKIIDNEKADLVHFPHFNVPLFCKTPFVLTLHDLILRHFPTRRASTLGPVKFYLKYLFYNFILTRVLSKAKKIIVPSFFIRNDVIKTFKINPDKLSVSYEGVSSLSVYVDLGKEYLFKKGIRDNYILYVGNCYPHKNIERLIQAFNIIKKEKNIQLVLVGKRDYFSKRIEEDIDYQFAKKYPEDIIFFGFASDEELITLYKHSSLYVFPSLMEGFGLPPLEAMLYGLPVVCSDIPVFHEVLGENVIYFNPKDINDMARVISNNLSNEKVKVNIDRYKWENHIREILRIYNRSLKR